MYTCDVNILRPGVRYLSTLFLITTSNAAAQVRIFPATDNRESKLPTTLINRKFLLFDQYVFIIWRTLTSLVCLPFIILSVSSYQRGISIIVMIVAALSITVSLVVSYTTNTSVTPRSSIVVIISESSSFNLISYHYFHDSTQSFTTRRFVLIVILYHMSVSAIHCSF